MSWSYLLSFNDGFNIFLIIVRAYILNLTFKGLLYFEKTYLPPYNYHYINIISIILEIFTSVEQREIMLESNILHLDTIKTKLQVHPGFLSFGSVNNYTLISPCSSYHTFDACLRFVE